MVKTSEKTPDKAPANYGDFKKKKRRWIGTMDLAAKLGCHPFSIPRFVKTKPGFPRPVKPFGRNLWDEDQVDAYLEKLLAERKEEVA